MRVDRGDIARLVSALHRQGDSQARAAMLPFLGAGPGSMDMALPVVRREAKRILHDADSIKVPRELRDLIKEFGTMWGLQTRTSSKSDEAMSKRSQVRFTETQWAEMHEAMDRLGVVELTDFIREAALKEARRVNESMGQ